MPRRQGQSNDRGEGQTYQQRRVFAGERPEAQADYFVGRHHDVVTTGSDVPIRKPRPRQQ